MSSQQELTHLNMSCETFREAEDSNCILDVKQETCENICVYIKQEPTGDGYGCNINENKNQDAPIETDKENEVTDCCLERTDFKEEPSENSDATGIEQEAQNCASLCEVKLEDATFQEDYMFPHESDSDDMVHDANLPSTSQDDKWGIQQHLDDHVASDSELEEIDTSLIQCQEQNCDASCFSTIQQLRNHLQSKHGIPFEVHIYEFASEKAFRKWKVALENETIKYVLARTFEEERSIMQVREYLCSRSGDCTQEHPHKLGFYCTASMMVLKCENNISVQLYGRHYGDCINYNDDLRRSLSNGIFEDDQDETKAHIDYDSVNNNLEAEMEATFKAASTRKSCRFCGKLFHTLLEQKLHLQVHSELNNLFICEECGRAYVSPQGLKRHSCVLKCNICGNKCSGLNKLLTHLCIRRQKFFTCIECGEDCGSKYLLKKHSRVHSEKPSVCKECGEVFTSAPDLKRHSSIHTQSIECNICALKFKNNNELAKHMSIHVCSTREYACRECSKTFSTPRELKKHSPSHWVVNPFRCEKCGNSFPTPTKYKSHLRMHREKPRLVCEMCGRTFAMADYLQEHIRIHTEKQHPFRCNVCQMTFTCSRGLDRHRKNLRHKRPPRHEFSQDEK